MNVNNNTILITGGASGIGLALATEFSKFENTIILVGRNVEKLRRVAMELPDATYYHCDLSDIEQVKKMAQWTSKNFPLLNVIINNAGIMELEDLVNDGQEASELQFLINYFAPIQLVQDLLPNFLRHPNAAIINVTTALVDVPFAAAPAYCASKAALHAYTSALKVQLEDTCVEVYEVLPPVVRTEMSSVLNLPGISPTVFAQRVLRELVKGTSEVRVGQAKLLYLLSRFSPRFIQAKMNRKSKVLLEQKAN